MVRPMLAATAQGTALACGSNLAGQYIDAYRSGRPFEFDRAQLIRFIIQSIIMIPPNWYWQILLERTFPARPKEPGYEVVALEEGIGGLRKAEDHERRYRQRDEHVTSRDRPAPLSIRNTAAKWFIDCMTIGALLNTTAFLIIIGLLKGHTTEAVMRSVQTETIPIILASYKIWPIASVINFALVPVERRILFLSSISFVWSIYMSIVAARV